MVRTFLLSGALMALASCAAINTPNEVAPDMSQKVREQLSITSQVGFAETSANLKAALEKRGLNIFAEVDHSAGAASVGKELPPTRLFIFGNPKIGSNFIQADGRIGIDLPMKMLVREIGPGEVEIRYTDIEALLTTYDIEGVEAPRAMAAKALNAIAQEAAGNLGG